MKEIAYGLSGAQSGAQTVAGASAQVPISTEGITTIAFHAVGNGGTVEPEQQVIVRLDTTPPTISVPAAAVQAEATGTANTKVEYAASAFDALDPTVKASCLPPSGSLFKLGTTTVTCTASDQAGNERSESFEVLVKDTTAPVIEATSITVEASSGAGTKVSYSITAHDNVDGPLPASCMPPSGSTFQVGTTTVDCTATDKAGNVGHGSLKVVITHAEGPVLLVPETVTAEATGLDGAKVNYRAIAYDAVDGKLTPTCKPASGSRFPIGTTTVSCTAADKAGNTAAAGFTVTVRARWPANSKPPQITGTPTVGSVLKASSGSWTGTPTITYGYQWQRCKPTCANIKNATSRNYTPTAADLGRRLRVLVIARNSAGSAQAFSPQVGPVAPSSVQIKALLLKHLTPVGKAAKIAAVLKAGGYSYSLRSPSGGRLTIEWYYLPNGASLKAPNGAPEPVLIATGKASFTKAAPVKLTVKLTAAGKQMLKAAKRLKLTAKGTYTPTANTPTATAKPFILKR